MRGHGGVFQLPQPGQHQRLDQQLKIGRVRGVVDSMPDSSRSLTPSGVALIGRVASRRLNGSQSADGRMWATAKISLPLQMNLAITSNLTGLSGSNRPAGRYRSRCVPGHVIRFGTRPPNELPTVWLVSQPSSPSWRVHDVVGQHHGQNRVPEPVRRCGRPSWGQMPRSGRRRPAAGRPSHTVWDVERV